MTNETSPCDLRGWARRTGLLVAATLVLSLSVGPGAHADGGLPGDAIGVVEGAVQQVQPVVETVQPTAPQPVPEVVEQVVEQVVEPTVAQVQETLEAVPGADRAAEPVTEAVDGIVRRPDEATEEPAESTSIRSDRPRLPLPPRTRWPPRLPRHPRTRWPPRLSVPGGPTGTHSADGSGHHEGPVAASTGAPRDDEVAGTRLCDLPPRVTALSALLRHPGGRDGRSADRTAWNLTRALMLLWAGSTLPHWNPGRLAGRTPAVAAPRLPGSWVPPVPTPGTSSAVRALWALLLGLLMAAGLAMVLTHHEERPA